MRRERIVLNPTRNNELVTDDLLNRGFKGATIAEMGVAVDTIIAKVRDELSESGALEQYRAIAARLPGRIVSEVQTEVLQAVTSDDADISTTARRIYLFFHIKSILSAVERNLGHDADENDDIVQAAMTSAYAGIPRIVSVQIAPHLEIYHLAEQGIREYFVSMESKRSSWITTGKYQVVREAVETLLREHPYGLDRSQVKKYAEEIAKNCGVGAQGVKSYLKNRLISVVPTLIEPEEISDTLTRQSVNDELRRIVATLPDKQKKIIELRFGLRDGELRTLEEVTSELGLSVQDVKNIEARTLRLMCQPSRALRLRRAIGLDFPPPSPRKHLSNKNRL